MAGPEYDFFATGPRPAAPSGAPGFGTTVTPSSAAPAVPAPSAPAAVNQFGLPVDTAAPTGPYAAPGYGSASAGIAAGVGLGDAPVHAAPVHGRRAAPVSDERPGTVLAAGIVALVVGGLLAVLAVLGLFAYLAAKSQMDAMLAPGAGEADLAGAEDFVSALLMAVLVGVLVLAVFAGLYLLLGVGTVRGHRGFAWGLLVVAALNVLYGVYQLVTGAGAADLAPGSGAGTLVSLAVSVAIVGLLTLGSGGAWLRRS